MHEWPVNYASYTRGYRVWWALISARRPFSFLGPPVPPGCRVPSRLQQPGWCSLLACKYRERGREREERLGKENCSTALVVVTPLRLTIFFHFPTPCYAFLSPSSRHLQFAPRVFPLPPTWLFPFLFYSSRPREFAKVSERYYVLKRLDLRAAPLLLSLLLSFLIVKRERKVQRAIVCYSFSSRG